MLNIYLKGINVYILICVYLLRVKDFLKQKGCLLINY